MTRRLLLLFLDAAMSLLLASLLSARLTGLRLHEWLGITVIVLALMHALVHWGWMHRRVARIVRPPRRGIGELFVNASLFASIGATLISGVVISKIVSPNGLSPATWMRWHQIHESATMLAVLLIGSHLVLNWARVRSALRSGIEQSRSAAAAMLTALKRTPSLAASVAVLIALTWLLARVLPDEKVMRVYADGRREIVPPPAEITQLHPGENRPQPRQAVPRLVASSLLLAAGVVATRRTRRRHSPQ